MLNKHALCKIKHVLGNQMLFFDKELSKTRTKLRSNFLQNKTDKNRKLYTKQRNIWVSFSKKIKKKYENLVEKSVIDNKLIWKTVKPFLSGKIVVKKKIHLTENGELIKTDRENAEILNYFVSIMHKVLTLQDIHVTNLFLDNIKDSAMKAILN